MLKVYLKFIVEDDYFIDQQLIIEIIAIFSLLYNNKEIEVVIKQDKPNNIHENYIKCSKLRIEID